MSFWSGKRVMVTGGGGFLGSHVVEQLRGKGCADIFIVRRREYDLTRENVVQRLFQDHPADVVLHLAGLVGGIGANEAQAVDDDNFVGADDRYAGHALVGSTVTAKTVSCQSGAEWRHARLASEIKAFFGAMAAAMREWVQTCRQLGYG